jgi:predicted  nucleic acid-binding Zn-ribbon protein
MTMPGPASLLRELHRLRRHTTDLEGQIERAPQALAAQQGRVARQQEVYRQAQDALKHLKVSNHEKEVTLRSKVQQIAKHEKQLNEATGKKEYDALQHEIDAERKAMQALEDEILDGMAEVEDRTAKLPEAEQAVKRVQEEARQFESSQEARLANLREQLAQAERQMKEIETSLPDDVRALYERQVNARGADALSAVEGRTCVACYTEITAQQSNELMQDRLVVCKSCGRILYVPE